MHHMAPKHVLSKILKYFEIIIEIRISSIPWISNKMFKLYEGNSVDEGQGD